ncbi:MULTISPECIES: restriction endonuclease subunit S [Schaalia]|uniref:restriction endonuclease subunit S n=1 Tax=Schaalia TaxID=2529408 RepID=UPI001F476766|nr:restriction endonuclease subunit S [Schaalia hyovaginalis]
MNRIERMVAEMCPDGVEYRPLGEVGVFIRGNGIQKSDFVDEGVAAVHYGQIHTRFGISTDHAVSKVPAEMARRLRHVEYGDLLIATTSEDDDAVGKATAWLGLDDCVIGGDAYIYRHSLDPKYVSHFFASMEFQTRKKKYLTGTKVRRISDASLSRILIPVPPIEIQREVVGILDSFTKLEAELEAELEARRVQYAFYRDRLLSFDFEAGGGALFEASGHSRSGGL